jgi:hypothetical protein
VNVARGLVKCFKAGRNCYGSIIDLVASADDILTPEAADKIRAPGSLIVSRWRRRRPGIEDPDRENLQVRCVD